MFKIRVIVGVMLFLGYFMIYVVRYNIAVHIVDMALIRMRDDDAGGATAVPVQRQFGIEVLHWDDITIATLLSAYHIGYFICFPIFHKFGDSLGPTWMVGVAGFASGVLHCLTPPAAYVHFWLLFTVRLLTGFCTGAMQPSMVQILRHWIPPVERINFMWAYCGVTMGTFSTMIICALVQYYSRWPVGFYVPGVLQIIWATVWTTAISDTPSKHNYISKEELDYLTNTIGTKFSLKLMNASAPWMLIMKSVPFWSLCILNFGYTWMIMSLCLYGPMYYSRVARYPIHIAAAITALPFLLRFILGTATIQIYQWCKNHTKVKKIKDFRKYFIVVSHVLPGLLVCSTWLMPGVQPGACLLTGAVSLTAAGLDFTIDMCYELAPNYGNAIMTVIKILGSTPGFILTFYVGAVTHKYNNSPLAWKHLWCSHGLVLCASGIIFLIFGQTHIQPWNAITRRPARTPRPNAHRFSMMSNIIEIDEDEQLKSSKIILQLPISQRGSRHMSISSSTDRFSQAKV